MKIVILGASGNAGREIARLLTPTLSAHDEVVLAGRNSSRLAFTAGQCSGPAAIRVEIADATDDEAVRRLVAGARLVVVTVSLPDRVPALARIVADAGSDWFDTLLSSPTKIAALRALEPQLLAGGLCFVTDGGFHPGLPAAMVRWAARRVDTLKTAVVYGGMRLDWRAETLADSTVEEMLGEFADFDMTTYIDGAWRPLKWSQCPTVDFGPPIGRKSCVPMYLAEMEPLPTEFPTLRTCGFYVGGFTPSMDYLALPVIMGLAKFPRLRRTTLAFTRWSFGHLARSRPPHRLAVRLEATGAQGGVPATARLEISGDDGYVMTAAPVVSCLRRVLDGSLRRPGLWLQAQLADPDDLLDDLAGLGLTVSRESSVPSS
jgi:saccharopine dehydrogenase (NAD+, L-lysine-forming)